MILAVWLLVLSAIAAVGSDQMISPAGADCLGQLRVALPGNPPVWELSDEVPISLLIRNEGRMDDHLIGGSTPIAQSVGVRRAFLVNGRRVTTAASGGIVIPAGATITLEPGTNHLALFGLRTGLLQGQLFPLTLQFERAGDVTILARVRRRVDAAGIVPLPEVSIGELTVALASAPPAPGP